MINSIAIGTFILLIINGVSNTKINSRTRRGLEVDEFYTLPYYTENMCETIKDLKNNTKNVFVLEHPMDENCIRDVARVADPNNGTVVLFGLNKFQSNILYLDYIMSLKNLVYYRQYDLPADLNDLFANYKYRAYVAGDELKKLLDNSVTKLDFLKAVSISKSLEEQNLGKYIREVVEVLLRDGDDSLAPFAYKLWENDGREIVKSYFPKQLTMVFSEIEVLLIYKKDYGRMRLSTNFTEQDLDRDVFTDCTKDDGPDLYWKFMTMWSGNGVSFRVWNPHYKQYLKIQQIANRDGSRNPWGGTNDWYIPGRFIWKLIPVRYSTLEESTYCFINIEHHQALTSDICNGDQVKAIAKSKPCTAENSWYIAEKGFVSKLSTS